MKRKNVEIYDTTLRDGAQGPEISFSAKDKLDTAEILGKFGIDVIEMGWPGSNLTDDKAFSEIRKHPLSYSKIAAFGSTHHPKHSADEDPNLRALVESGASNITIFGKSSTFHVEKVLRISLERNLELIEDSLSWLRISPQVKRVIYDAEHYIDGHRANPEYALETLSRAVSGGAECLVLCDTNGGTLPHEITEIVQDVRDFLGSKIEIGIHCHNDFGLAVANTIAAILAGATQAQGTMNGIGERCGNTDLCGLMAILWFKLGYQFTAGGNLEQLTRVSKLMYEIANMSPWKSQPVVGRNAFTHTGGIHIHGMMLHKTAYESISPESVGNERSFSLSDLAGRSAIITKAEQFGLKLEKNDPLVRDILAQLKELENQGFQFESAEASFELLMRKAFDIHQKYFDLLALRIIDQKFYENEHAQAEAETENEHAQAEATVRVRVPNGQIIHTAALGNGLVNAMDNAIRKALEEFYPQLKKMTLEDYKVRVLSGSSGTEAMVRVLIESKDQHGNSWGTVGLSHDIVEASWQALADSIRFWLFKSEETQ